MKNFKFQLYILAAITLIGILATVISPALTIAVGPDQDPPKGNVAPNFSGLTVTGTTTLQSTLNANGTSNFRTVNIDGDNDGTNDLVVDSAGDVFVNNRFEVDSNNNGEEDILAYGNENLQLGRYPNGQYIYVVNDILPQINISTNPGSFGVNFLSDDVFFYDSGVGSNANVEIHGDLKADKVGSYYKMQTGVVSDTNWEIVTCKTNDFLTGCSGYSSVGLKYAWPTGRSCSVAGMANGSMNAFAICFDPDGLRSGTNPSN